MSAISLEAAQGLEVPNLAAAILPAGRSSLQPRNVPAILAKFFDLTPEFSLLLRSPFSCLARLEQLYQEINRSDQTIVRPISRTAILAGAFVGGFFYDLCGASFGRRKCEDLMIKLCSAIILFDRFIDETQLSSDSKLELIPEFYAALTRGEVSRKRSGQLHDCYQLGKEVHSFVAASPNPQPFFNELRLLALAVADQIKGDCSYEQAFRMTAHTAGTLALLPAGMLPHHPEKLLDAVRHFGAVIQLADNIKDVNKDRASGIPTFMTTAADPEAARKEALQFACLHAKVALGALSQRERRKLCAFATVLSAHWESFGPDFWLRAGT